MVALEEKVPVINYSMGKGDWIADAAHAYGGKVMASVTSVKLAESAQRQGADAVIAAGYEAAGHSGEIGIFVLIPRLAEVLDIPVIAAGGCATGAQLVAVLALGGAGVSMGTRFVTTAESPWHPNFKQAAVALDVSDTVRSDKFDGIPCRMMGTDRPKELLTARLNPFQALMNSFEVARDLDIPYFKLLRQVLTTGPGNTLKMMRMSQMLKDQKRSLQGDLKKGMTASGQSVGLVKDLPPIAEVMERIVNEAREAQSRLCGAW